MFEVPDPVPTPDANANVQTSIEVNVIAPAANNLKIFQVIDARSAIVMNDNHLVITEPDRSVRLLGQLCDHHLAIGHPGRFSAKRDPVDDDETFTPSKLEFSFNSFLL